MGNCCKTTEPIPLSSTSMLQIPDEIESKLINIRSFNLITVLGKGAFGKVLLMEKKDTKKLYAIKTIQKQKLYNAKKKSHALMERKVLAQITSPFVVKLHYAFQSFDKLYLVLDFMQGGDLYYHLSREKYFKEEDAKFFAVEIVLALQDLHSHGIIYRDLKPENVLMDVTGHIKLTDFNLATHAVDNEKSSSMCGTPEYVSPEIIKGSPHGKEVDFWGLGCMIYEMIEGKSPFHASNYKDLFTKIVNGHFKFSERFSVKVKDLVSQLLVVSLKSRLTNLEKIKGHPFFEDIDWDSAYLKKLLPPIIPIISSESDTKYFHINAGNDGSPNPNWNAQQRENNAFQGFTYEESLHTMLG